MSMPAKACARLRRLVWTMSSTVVPPETRRIQDCPTTPYRQFVLFGDSITQGSFDQSRGFAFGAQLAHDYVRRLDVINRGYNGYTTDNALACVPDIFPPPQVATIECLTVFFGANDAVTPNWPWHVPVARFADNLRAILTHPLILAHNPRILLITTPAVDEYQLPTLQRPDGSDYKARTAELARAYAQAGKAVGEEVAAAGGRVAVCDMWTAMLERAGWRGETPLPGSLAVARNPVFTEMLYDGLHLNDLGYRILHAEIRKVMAQAWPESEPEGFEKHFPEWTSWYMHTEEGRRCVREVKG